MQNHIIIWIRGIHKMAIEVSKTDEISQKRLCTQKIVAITDIILDILQYPKSGHPLLKRWYSMRHKEMMIVVNWILEIREYALTAYGNLCEVGIKQSSANASANGNIAKIEACCEIILETLETLDYSSNQENFVKIRIMH